MYFDLLDTPQAKGLAGFIYSGSCRPLGALPGRADVDDSGAPATFVFMCFVGHKDIDEPWVPLRASDNRQQGLL